MLCKKNRNCYLKIKSFKRWKFGNYKKFNFFSNKKLIIKK